MLWIDYADLRPGEDFVDELPAIISKVNTVIPVVGPSGESKWVAKEAICAHTTGKFVIPVVIGKARFEDELIGRKSPVVLRDEEDAEGLNRLFWAILKRRRDALMNS